MHTSPQSKCYLQIYAFKSNPAVQPSFSKKVIYMEAEWIAHKLHVCKC